MVEPPVLPENGAKIICGNTSYQNQFENRSMQALPQEGLAQCSLCQKEGTAWSEHTGAHPCLAQWGGEGRNPWISQGAAPGLQFQLTPGFILPAAPAGILCRAAELTGVFQAVPQPWLWSSALPNSPDVAPPEQSEAHLEGSCRCCQGRSQAGNGGTPSLLALGFEDEHGFVPG